MSEYGRSLNISAAAIAEDPTKTMFSAMNLLFRNMLATHKERPLDLDTLTLAYIAPTPGAVPMEPEGADGDPSNTTIAWKASARE